MVSGIVANGIRIPIKPNLLALGTLASCAGALLFALVGVVVMPSGATAQYYYSNPYGYSNQRYRGNRYYQQRRVRKRKKRVRRKKRSRRSYAKTLREPISDVLVLVSLKKQRIYVHDKKGLVAEAPISSGRRGMDTPKGIFTILQKNKRHFSNLYAGAPMPNMQRITWSGVAMHGGPLPGYPASHGCIRLPYSFANKLFGITSMHGRVIVADNPVQPKPIQHTKLFQPFPATTPTLTTEAKATAGGNINVAEAETRTRIDTDLGTIIGVRPANAGETRVARLADPERIERATAYRLKRLKRKEQSDKELAKAQTAYDLFHIDAKRTAKQLGEARTALKAGVADVKTKKKNAKKADYIAKKAHKALKDFDRKNRRLANRKLSPDKRQKLAAREKELDMRAIRLTDAAHAAQKAVTSAERRIAGLEANVALAAQTHKTAKNKLVPVKKRLTVAKVALKQYAEEEKQRAKPISIFVSGKTGRLYARQGWQPIIDVPVTIRSPNVALGTHLFTAIDAKESGHGVEWNVVTIEDGTKGTGAYKTRRSRFYGKKAGLRRQRSTPNPGQLALDRIEIPQDARDKIEDLMKPGSSIIVSDYPKSNETGQHTDFIILTK